MQRKTQYEGKDRHLLNHEVRLESLLVEALSSLLVCHDPAEANKSMQRGLHILTFKF
jgi:hypothetical protein